jgi:hypothetical protein
VVQISLSALPDTWQEKALEHEKSIGKHSGGKLLSLFGTLLSGVEEKEHANDSHDSHATQKEGIREKAKKAGLRTSIRVLAS